MARIWERRYWMGPVVFAALLVVFLIQRLWIDSAIVGGLLAVLLIVFALLGRYERNVRDEINRAIEADREQG